MHKDPRPGIFEFDRHSLRYAIGLGLTTGFTLSILVYGGLFIWRADSAALDRPKASAAALEASMTARRYTPAPTAAPTAATHY